jgi:hypothetical protein
LVEVGALATGFAEGAAREAGVLFGAAGAMGTPAAFVGTLVPAAGVGAFAVGATAEEPADDPAGGVAEPAATGALPALGALAAAGGFGRALGAVVSASFLRRTARSDICPRSGITGAASGRTGLSDMKSPL